MDAVRKQERYGGRLSMDHFTYEEYLEQYGKLVYTNVGISMLPLMREGKDLFYVEKKGQERCRKYDVVLYRRPPASYVLHRIIAVREQDYVIRGDNSVHKEYGITDADIIGVMTGFVRGESKRVHSTAEIPYQLYSRFWVAIAPLRITWKRVKGKLKGMRHEA